MKSSIFYASFFVLALMFSGCDKVENPFVVKNIAIGSNYVKNSNASVSNFRKVLLEDYTGQQCPNCPAAARTIKNDLIPSFGDTLVVMAVHQGNTFAKPAGSFTNDFRTTEGEAWGSNSGFGVVFWPCGLVNRSSQGSGTLIVQNGWKGAITTAKKQPFIIKLDVNTEYDTTARALNLKVKALFKQNYPNRVKILAVILEDHIEGKQKDGSVEIEEYEFEHMMRGSLNGEWGTDLVSTSAQAGDTTNFEIKNWAMPAIVRTQPVVDKNLTIVVFAYDGLTRAVLQAEKVKLIALESAGN